jgi:ankyrin repeat protein
MVETTDEKDDRSQLHHACSIGHIDVVKELIEKGV